MTVQKHLRDESLDGGGDLGETGLGVREELLAALPAARRGVHDLPAFVHVLTHKDLHLHPVRIDGGQPQGEAARWFEADEWSRLGLPAPMRKLLEGGEA